MPINRLLLAAWLCLASPSAWAALALDGTASGSANASASTVATTTGITTTIGTDIVIAAVSDYANGTAPTVSGVSGCSLSWSKRGSTGSLSMASTFQGNVELWYAKAGGSTCSAATITATLSGAPTSGVSDIVVFAVSGADNTTPFDVNGSIPKSGHGSTGTQSVTGVSTTAANTMIIAVTNFDSSKPSPGSGYTTITTTNTSDQDNQYKVVSSKQSSVTVSFGGTSNLFGWVAMADAIQQAGAAPSSGNFVFIPATVP
jgi:hypothetical protein